MASQKPLPVQSPHDTLFRETFSKAERAAELLKCSVSRELAATIDWFVLELESGSFVDGALRWRHTALLFRAELSGEPLFMFLLMEHQSSDDRMMAFRMLRYVVCILDAVSRGSSACQGAARSVAPGGKPFGAPVVCADRDVGVVQAGRRG